MAKKKTKKTQTSNAYNNAAITANSLVEDYEANDVADASQFDYQIGGDGSDENTIKNILTSGNINGIFGMPYQFLSSVDRRIGDNNDTEEKMGRKYSEKIAAHLPLLFLTPCRQHFMEGYNKNAAGQVLDDIINGSGASGAVTKQGRYYTAQFAYDEYYWCVSRMALIVAKMCGVLNENVNFGRSHGTIKDLISNLGNGSDYFRNESFDNYFAASSAVVFYVDGLSTISDSFSNSTTDSSLASTINGFSDQAKEIRFLTGSNKALSGMYNEAKDTISGVLSSISDIGGSITSGMLGDLASTGVSTIMTGGKIIFPKIWGDSSFSRSYSFDIKLRSPDHDNLSIFLNILLPYLHILGLCLPQSITKGDAAQSPNAYDTPFLVKAYAKGMFNINMGMVTDVSVTRGAESQWNDNGLPTQIDISITIEDLYSTLFMTNPGQFNPFLTFDIVKNTEMVDFLSNLAGLNVAADDWGKKAALATLLAGSTVTSIPANLYNKFDTKVQNVIRRLHETILG